MELIDNSLDSADDTGEFRKKIDQNRYSHCDFLENKFRKIVRLFASFCKKKWGVEVKKIRCSIK